MQESAKSTNTNANETTEHKEESTVTNNETTTIIKVVNPGAKKNKRRNWAAMPFRTKVSTITNASLEQAGKSVDLMIDAIDIGLDFLDAAKEDMKYVTAQMKVLPSILLKEQYNIEVKPGEMPDSDELADLIFDAYINNNK